MVSDTPILLPEILVLIFEESFDITSTGTLYNLALTCRTYNSIVTPLLYRKVRISRSLLWPRGSEPELRAISGLQTLAANRHGVKSIIRSLEICNFDATDGPGFSALVKILKDALENCFELETLRFETTRLTPLLLASFKKLPKISSVFIRFDDQAYSTWSNDHSFFLPISGFNCLTCLEVFSIYGPLLRYVNDVTKVLLASPGLRKLGLSISEDTVEYGIDNENEAEDYEKIVIHPNDPDWNVIDGFWESTCARYGHLSDGERLPICHLTLGRGMFIRYANEDRNYMSEMLNLDNLHTLIYNNESGDCDGWNQLNPSTSLSRITVATIDEEFLNFLEGRSAPLLELHVVEVEEEDKIDRLLKILQETTIEILSLNEANSLNNSQQKSLRECKNLRYLEVALGYNDDSDEILPLSHLDTLSNLEGLSILNHKGEDFIKSAFWKLLCQGRFSRLKALSISPKDFLIERSSEGVKLRHTDFPLDDRLWLLTQ